MTSELISKLTSESKYRDFIMCYDWFKSNAPNVPYDKGYAIYTPKSDAFMLYAKYDVLKKEDLKNFDDPTEYVGMPAFFQLHGGVLPMNELDHDNSYIGIPKINMNDDVGKYFPLKIFKVYYKHGETNITTCKDIDEFYHEIERLIKELIEPTLQCQSKTLFEMYKNQKIPFKLLLTIAKSFSMHVIEEQIGFKWFVILTNNGDAIY